MAAQCFNCGKGIMYGHNVSHAKNRTRKIFKPNLHSVRIIINGVAKRVKLCTKCVRKFKKSIHVEVVPQVAATA
jgi:large subunit ribosomal protein L28